MELIIEVKSRPKHHPYVRMHNGEPQFVFEVTQSQMDEMLMQCKPKVNENEIC